MKIRLSVLALALSTVFSAGAWASVMSAAEAEATLVGRGYSGIATLEYDGGLWSTTATNASGVRVEVRIDAANRRLIEKPIEAPVVLERVVEKPVVVERVVEKPVVVERVVEQPVVQTPVVVENRILVPAGGKISKTEVRVVLASAGYHNIHDIDWLNNRGVWKAEARDPYGDDREIHVDPLDGRILHVEDD